jgi:flagellum-specific ATP synthase
VSTITLQKYVQAIQGADLQVRRGRVKSLIGLVIEVAGLRAEIGELCSIAAGRNAKPVAAEVVGFRDGATLLMPFGSLQGIGPGNPVTASGEAFLLPVGEDLLGRVLDGLGRPIDELPPPRTEELRSTVAMPPPPLLRSRITERLSLGVRALDGFAPCGTGQRLGIFAGSGVGKSTLLGMIAGATSADVNVICLCGERGREVRDFVERDLGDALAHSVVVVATSDEPPLVRIKAAFTATTIAEWFRDRGQNVLLMMDSVTRLATAQREVGLAIGEPPAARGYTPSVFALLPRLLERAGTSEQGSITGLYTVLVDGDDMNDPIADAVRSILDGHIVLTRELAHRSHYPAVDVLQSVSRLANEVSDPEVRRAESEIRELVAVHREKEDLISIGAYSSGSDARIDRAIELMPAIESFLRQPVGEHAPASVTDAGLVELAAMANPSADLSLVDQA